MSKSISYKKNNTDKNIETTPAIAQIFISYTKPDIIITAVVIKNRATSFCLTQP